MVRCSGKLYINAVVLLASSTAFACKRARLPFHFDLSHGRACSWLCGVLHVAPQIETLNFMFVVVTVGFACMHKQATAIVVIHVYSLSYVKH